MIDHHLLGVHHVHPGANQLAWDVGFLAFGALLMAAGALLEHRRAPDPSTAHGGRS